MKAVDFDGLAERFAAAQSRRRMLLGVGAALAAAGGTSAQVAEDEARGGCSTFILAAGPNRDDKFKHVDDDFKVELRRKSGRRWETIFDDNDGQPNDGTKHIKPIEFRAKEGDLLRITATNRVAGGCGLDEVYLYCKNGGRGKRLLERYLCRPEEEDKLGVFLDETFRIRV